jgi:peptidase E
VPATGRILACGGGGDFDGLVLELSGKPRPRVCFLPTASGDQPAFVVRFYERFLARPCDPFHVTLFGMPERPAEQVASADVVWVSGGNTANMLALWDVHGIDEALRKAWRGGAVLAGSSAGGNCWFEASVTDSFGPQLSPLTDGLGLLAGSFCPHYDGEALRRPVFTQLVSDGTLPAGVACDEAAAVLYEGTELMEVVATEPDARAYRVTREGEDPIQPRFIG